MPRYNSFYYLNGYYGTRAALAYSAEPISATALDYDSILVEWTAPTGTYSDFRIVRSQLGFPQTQEDGVILYSSIGVPAQTSFVDSSNIASAPLVSGRFAFYRAWVRRADSSYWVPAGDAFTLLPSPHPLGVGRDAVYTALGPDGFTNIDKLIYSDNRVNPMVSTTHQRFMALLPRVLTTTTNSGTDVIQNEYDEFANPSGVDGNTLISTFLSAFSFTFDEFLTSAGLVVPDTVAHWSNPTSVYLGSQQLGLTLDVEPVTKTQRALLRNAIDIYSQKGTYPGLELLIQSMTNYDVTLTDTVNLLPTIADATFNAINWVSGPVGGWSAMTDDLTIAPYTEGIVLDNIAVPKSLDRVYCLKVNVTADNAKIELGNAYPVTTGIPVKAGLPYCLSFYEKGDETSVVTEIRWYDRFGDLISVATSTPISVGGLTWDRQGLESTVAPAGAVYAGLTFTFIDADTELLLDMVQFEQAEEVTDYQEPRGVVITLNPSKRNYIKNPSFALTTDYWAAGGATVSIELDTENARSSINSLKATMARESSQVRYTEPIPVEPGLYYSASMFVKDISSLKSFQVSILLTDEGGTTEEEYVGPFVATNRNSWTRVSHSIKIPAGMTKAYMRIISNESFVDNGQALFDAAQFEQAFVPTDYFDGYLTDDGGEWEGETGDSYSVNYPAKSQRLQRLATEIQDYIGFDTPYYIRTAEGAYTSGIS